MHPGQHHIRIYMGYHDPWQNHVLVSWILSDLAADPFNIIHRDVDCDPFFQHHILWIMPKPHGPASEVDDDEDSGIDK